MGLWELLQFEAMGKISQSPDIIFRRDREILEDYWIFKNFSEPCSTNPDKWPGAFISFPLAPRISNNFKWWTTATVKTTSMRAMNHSRLFALIFSFLFHGDLPKRQAKLLSFETWRYEGHLDRDRTSAITQLWDEIIRSFKRLNLSTSDFRVDGTS